MPCRSGPCFTKRSAPAGNLVESAPDRCREGPYVSQISAPVASERSPCPRQYSVGKTFLPGPRSAQLGNRVRQRYLVPDLDTGGCPWSPWEIIFCTWSLLEVGYSTCAPVPPLWSFCVRSASSRNLSAKDTELSREFLRAEKHPVASVVIECRPLANILVSSETNQSVTDDSCFSFCSHCLLLA